MASAPNPLRVLIIEDSADDAQLLIEQLGDAGYDLEYVKVETLPALQSALKSRTWDLVLSDHSLPAFNAEMALKAVQESGLDLPFIIVSGVIGEEQAVDLMKAGAHDYVMKSNVRRLIPAIARELEETKIRRARKQAEAALKESEAKYRGLAKDLERALQARDEFLAIASHELKTPLTPLKLQVQTLIRAIEQGHHAAVTPEKIKRLAERLNGSIDKIIRLVDTLLDVARINSGNLDLKREEVDLITLVREAADQYCADAKASLCQVVLEGAAVPHGLWDRLRIEQVIMNLVTNAIKHSGGKPIHLTVSSDGEWATLKVRDEGPGIPPQSLGRLFNRFERIQSERGFGGLGLGLYISKKIVDVHGGKIWAESEYGHGSTFVVKLPLAGKQIYSGHAA